MPQLLTSATFVERVTQFHADNTDKVATLAQKKVAREERAVAIMEWKQAEEA
jgi:hypothetical protein